MENIDERLLAATQADRKRQEEMANGDRLRQDKMASADKNRQEEISSEPKSLRQAVFASKSLERMKQKAKEKIEKKVAAPMKAGTGKLLRYSWLNIIDSFGLTLIYINIHVFLRWVLGDKLFCKLGEEWLPKQITSVGGEAGKSLNKSIGIVEVMGLVLVDLVAGIIIFGALGLIVMIMGWVENPLKALADLGWGAISVLTNIFKAAISIKLGK